MNHIHCMTFSTLHFHGINRNCEIFVHNMQYFVQSNEQFMGKSGVVYQANCLYKIYLEALQLIDKRKLTPRVPGDLRLSEFAIDT